MLINFFSKECYARKFEENGYEYTKFLAGMTEEELEKIGIERKNKIVFEV